MSTVKLNIETKDAIGHIYNEIYNIEDNITRRPITDSKLSYWKRKKKILMEALEEMRYQLNDITIEDDQEDYEDEESYDDEDDFEEEE